MYAGGTLSCTDYPCSSGWEKCTINLIRLKRPYSCLTRQNGKETRGQDEEGEEDEEEEEEVVVVVAAGNGSNTIDGCSGGGEVGTKWR